GNRALGAKLAGAVDDAHPAVAEFALQDVTREARPLVRGRSFGLRARFLDGPRRRVNAAEGLQVGDVLFEFGQQFGAVAAQFRCWDCTALPSSVLPEKEQFVDRLGRHPRNASLGRAAFPTPTESNPGSCDIDLSVMLTPLFAPANRKVRR